jgi:hypothetical protein
MIFDLLPGTRAALLDGTITRYMAEIIARATALLDDAGARAAEQKVLDRAARLTPGRLRAAIAAAVMEVSAVTTTGSSSTPNGEWTSSPTGPSAGPPQPAGPTTLNPRATRSRRAAS